LKGFGKIKRVAIVLTGLLALLAPAGTLAQGPAREPDTSDLQRQLQEMRSQMNRMQSRIDELERAQANSGTNSRTQLAAQDQPCPSQGPTSPRAKPADSRKPPPKPAGTFGSGPWVFTLGGYIKLDLIHDFNAIGSTDSFNPRTIPADGIPGTNTRFHARETRLSLGIAGPVEGRDLKLFVEGDFYGTASGFRLRHAYGEYGPLLAGQTWTTFMDEANIPHTIDFETPLAAPLVRQGLLRLTARPSKRTQLALGIEESEPEVLPPPGVAGKTEKTLPDFTGRFRFTNGRGHVQLSGFVGQTRFRPNKGEPTDITIYGGLASARFRTLLRDVAYAQVGYGPGLGRYRGDLSAAPDAAGHLKAVKVMALTLGYEHYWAARWSSNFVASPAWVLSDLGDPPTFNRRFDYVAANLRYWFLGERAWLGGEYLYGLREVRSRDRGSANRLQLAVRFNIP
jgi:DcaP outer membrane protein